MVRRKLKLEDGENNTATAASPPLASADVAQSTKSSKKKNKKTKQKKSKPKQQNVDNDSASSSSSHSIHVHEKDEVIERLQLEVGKLNAFSQVMMRRVNFYEQQLELLWETKQVDNNKDLLQQFDKLLDSDKKSTKKKQSSSDADADLNLHVASLQEQQHLTAKWIHKLEQDRGTYQQRLEATFAQLRSLKAEQHSTANKLQQLQLQQQQRNETRERDLKMSGVSTSQRLQDSAARNNNSATSKHLVDDMMDTFYKEYMVSGTGDGKNASSSKKKPSSSKTKSSKSKPASGKKKK